MPRFACIANAAQELGLPLLPPSKRSGGGGDFRRGANMAIVGATALDFDFLKSIGLGYPIWNNGAMNVQLQWFHHLLPSICATQPQGKNQILNLNQNSNRSNYSHFFFS
jgi:hypothetical protein